MFWIFNKNFFWPQLVCKAGDKKTFLPKSQFVEWFWQWARIQHTSEVTEQSRFIIKSLSGMKSVWYRNGIPLASTPASTTDNKRIYYNTMEAVDFVLNDSHEISLANYHNHYIMVFNLTSTQEASHDFTHPYLTNWTISVELKFDAALGENVSNFHGRACINNLSAFR